MAIVDDPGSGYKKIRVREESESDLYTLIFFLLD
jgi:hypothetical protein